MPPARLHRVREPPPRFAAPFAAAGAELDVTVFSAPMAAAHLAQQDVVAGLVAAEGTVRVLGMVDGEPVWSADAVTASTWAPDAELHLEAAGDAGVVLVWRGPRVRQDGARPRRRRPQRRHPGRPARGRRRLLRHR